MSAPATPIAGLPEHPFTDIDVQHAAQVTPLAGGGTYTPEYTQEDADVVVSEPREFARADSNDVVYIADGTHIDVTGLDPFDLDGTVVCGGRHKNGVEPGMVEDTEGGPGSVSYKGIFRANNTPGHVHGIRIRGSSWYPERAGKYEKESPIDARCWPGYTHIPKTNTRAWRDKQRSKAFGRGINLLPDGCTVRNCDIHGFTHAGVSVGAKYEIPKGVEITHSMIHNCAIPGLGYPLNIYNGEVLSKYNYYNAYRHSITGFGHPTLGYTTRYDVHGPDALLSPVDMHNLNENGSAGNMTAGKYVHCDHSTFLASHRFETPTWYSKQEQPALGIRGYPEDNIYVTNCQFMQGSQQKAMNHVNVSSAEKYDGWHMENNEYGMENWTAGNGSSVTFTQGVSGAVPDAGRAGRRTASRSRSRALLRPLNALKFNTDV